MMEPKEAPKEATARHVAGNLREQDYAFTVEAAGFIWDVYRFSMALLDTRVKIPVQQEHGRGTIAFRMLGPDVRAAEPSRAGQAIIGVLQSGELTREQTTKALIEAEKPQDKTRSHFVKGYVRNGKKIAGYYRS